MDITSPLDKRSVSISLATFWPRTLYYNGTMTAPTDRDLIARAMRGSNDAFGELVAAAP